MVSDLHEVPKGLGRKPKISTNQLAEYSTATEARKNSILKQQKNPPKVMVAWYQLSRSRLKKCIADGGDYSHIYQGIQELKNKSQKSLGSLQIKEFQ